MKRGFTLIELIVAIVITAVLSGVVLFSITQYINKGKDSNISGNLAVLVPAGEVFYYGSNNSYEGFCDVDINSVIKNIIPQMPKNLNGSCYDAIMPSAGNVSGNPYGVCCNVAIPGYQAWAACAREFTDSSSAYCVDSRGVKKDIPISSCKSTITECP